MTTTRLGRYELHRLLGEGGMGRVYEADLCGPAGFRKRVALKVLKSGGAGLAHEARLGGLLRHPNLVEVYELGSAEVDGEERWYCAMERVSGRISDHVPMPPSAALDVIRQAAAGLAHAHREVGLVHLDLKPGNLLVENGVVKVADLGISQAHGVATHRHQGTPAYMSPEHTQGLQVDARADVFSLGVVLVALVTGKPEADPAAVPELRAFLERCLATDPNARFRNLASLHLAASSIELIGPDLRGVLEARAPSLTSSTGLPTSDTFSFATMPAAPSSNLPPEPDRLVGREERVREVVERLGRPCTLTLKGIGGIGKTRLAMAAARRWHEDTGQPAWFCDLSECRSNTDALTTLAAVFELPGGKSDEEALAAQLGRALSTRGAMVLVLDNLEQLPRLAKRIEKWREQAPSLRALVTSREPLHIRGETILELHPLEPTDAVQLLIDRAQERGAQLEPSPDLEALAVALDGLPLALELAAARLTMLSPAAVLGRLHKRLALLGRGRRGAPSRQATLRGALDWSWELLDPHERTALAQLGCFAGGFTIDAAEAVLILDPDAPWALDLVQSLLDRSLLTARETPQGPRFGMFESVRAYALHQLDERPEEERRALQAAHLAHYAELGSTAAINALRSHGSSSRWEELLPERDNLSAACSHGVEISRGEQAAACCRALWAILSGHGPAERGLELAEPILSLELTAASRSSVLRIAGAAAGLTGGDGVPHCTEAVEVAVAGDCWAEAAEAGMLQATQAWALGQTEQSESLARQALEYAERTRDSGLIGRAMVAVGLCLLQRGDLIEARELYEKALRHAQRAGDRRYEGVSLGNLAIVADDLGEFELAEGLYIRGCKAFRDSANRRGEANCLSNLAAMRNDRGDQRKAERDWRRARKLAREVGDRRVEGILLGHLGTLSARQGEVDLARSRYEEALAANREMQNVRFEGVCLSQLGRLALAAGNAERAAELFEAALALHRKIDDKSWQATDLRRRAILSLVVGSRKAALADANQAVELARSRHQQTLGFALLTRAECRAVLGEAAAASTDLDEATPLLDTEDESVELLLARVRVAALDGTDLETAWREAKARFDALEPPGVWLAHEYARTLAMIP